jgi:hypothetical protein
LRCGLVCGITLVCALGECERRCSMRVKLEYGRTGLFAELPAERVVRTL